MFASYKITFTFLQVSHHFHFLKKHIALVLICERGEEMVSGLLDPFRWLEVGLNTSWNKSIAAWCQINPALNPYLGTIGRVRENSYQTAKGHITGFSKCPAVSLILIKIIGFQPYVLLDNRLTAQSTQVPKVSMLQNIKLSVFICWEYVACFYDALGSESVLLSLWFIYGHCKTMVSGCCIENIQSCPQLLFSLQSSCYKLW